MRSTLSSVTQIQKASDPHVWLCSLNAVHELLSIVNEMMHEQLSFLEYCVTPDCSRRWSFTSEPLCLIGFEERQASCPCSACLPSDVFRTNLKISTSDILQTASPPLRTVDYARGERASMLSADEFITVYPFPNISSFSNHQNITSVPSLLDFRTKWVSPELFPRTAWSSRVFHQALTSQVI